jgi:putative endonuclease
MTRQGVGLRGEAIAQRHLRSLGYEILASNWRSAEGEIDLIARQGEELVFVEVKARASRRYGPPEEAVTPAKQRRLQRTALAYLTANDLHESAWRVDVIAIDLSPSGAVVRLEHYPDAIEGRPDLSP